MIPFFSVEIVQEPKLPFEKMLEVDENQLVNAKASDTALYGGQ